MIAHSTRYFSHLKVTHQGIVTGTCDICGVGSVSVEDHSCAGRSDTPPNLLPDHITINVKGGYASITVKSMASLFALDETFPDALWMDRTVAIPERQLGPAIAAIYKYIKEES